MAQERDSKTEFAASEAAHKKSPLPRIGRMILCVLSMGMIYPNAFTEGVDMEAYEARSNQAPKK
jgi:hypothetical protein